jgi:hypothetical protein
MESLWFPLSVNWRLAILHHGRIRELGMTRRHKPTLRK